MIHILIPTYNRHKYLKSLLNDLSQQHFKEFDVRICSDGFDQVVLDMVIEYDKKNYQPFHYMHTIQRANDWGLSPRRLLVNSISDEDSYIVFIDDDDVICPQYLSKLTEGRSQDTISYCNLFMADETVNGERIIPGREVTEFNYGFISAFCCLLPIDVVRKCFYKWTEIRDSDFDFVYECSKHKKLKYIPYILAVAR